MAALRISRPGKPTELVILEPAIGRRQGYGGMALGYLSGTVIQKPKAVPKPPLRDWSAASICGQPVLFGGICHRTPGHGTQPGASQWSRHHSSKAAVERRNALRRGRL